MPSLLSSTRTAFKTALGSLLLQYFRSLARLQLAKIRPTIIGITGSAGKTSTLHAVHAVLKPHFSTKASYKANSESGLPLNILDLSAERFTAAEWLKLVVQAPLQLLTNWKKYELYIAEMGIDGPHPPKNMAYLLSIFQPKVGVLLNARPMHSQGFDALVSPKNETERKALVSQAIAEEKGRMIAGLPPDGLAVLNADDAFVAKFAGKTRAKVCLFGASEASAIRLITAEQTIAGTRFAFETVYTPEQESSKPKRTAPHIRISCTFPKYVLPTHFGYSLAAAIGVGQYFGITADQACRNLEKNYQLPPGRASLLNGINNSYILDSSYNSSAQAALDMLELLHSIAPGRKIALLGDIRELGAVAEQEHATVAQRAAELCDSVVLVGPQMQQFALPIIAATKTPVQWFANAKQATKFLQTQLRPKDTLLVKGSQNTLLLEITVERLLAHPPDAEKLLCRRGDFWNQQRSLLTNNSIT
jgi:UDP-N-acetylmuramoyl-tripeptide--D-alanyl-D-alanine ligase